MTEESDFLKDFIHVLQTDTRCKLDDLVSSYLPDEEIVVNHEIYDDIHRIIRASNLIHRTLIEEGILDSNLMTIKNYSLVEGILSQLRSQRKTVRMFLESNCDQDIFRSYSNLQFKDLVSAMHGKIGDKVLFLPDFETLRNALESDVEQSNRKDEVHALINELKVIQRDTIESATNNFSYENAWNEIQKGKLDKLIRDCIDFLEKPQLLDDNPKFYAPKWNEDKIEVFDKLFKLLSGKMFEDKVSKKDFKKIFSGDLIDNIIIKIKWNDKLINIKNVQGQRTLSTLLYWIYKSELVTVPESQEIIPTFIKLLKQVFLSPKGKPIKRIAPINTLKGEKHKRFREKLDSLLSD